MNKELIKEGFERRYCKSGELRAKKKENGGVTIEGYAILFDTLSENLGWFKERIVSTAFDGILGETDCRCLFNHNESLILGRESAKTLRLEKRDVGIWMENDLPDTQYARDLEISINRGDITQQSFGFIVKTDSWEYNRDTNEETRVVLEVKELLDVSPVTFPAYVDTTIAKRSRDLSKKPDT